MRRRPRQLSLKECYAILKIEKKADLQTVKRAYRRRAFELHPDLNPDNPEASQQFQLLNEAYVALSAVLKPAEDAARKKAAQKNRDSNEQRTADTGQAKDTSGADTSHHDTNQQSSHGGEHSQGHHAGQDNAHAGDKGDSAGDNKKADQTGTTHAYAEQDVLRDLLNDPFARRVFEDIYSELSRQQGETSQATASGTGSTKPQTGTGTGQSASQHTGTGPQAKSHRPDTNGQQSQQPPGKNSPLHSFTNLAGGIPKWDVDMSKGVKGTVKGWLRRQIDEEQSICLPVAGLAPGRRVRLQIRKALAAEPTTIEITLPADFVIGKPIRLRGLGKKVGPWQGDLYLTIRSQ